MAAVTKVVAAQLELRIGAERWWQPVLWQNPFERKEKELEHRQRWRRQRERAPRFSSAELVSWQQQPHHRKGHAHHRQALRAECELGRHHRTAPVVAFSSTASASEGSDTSTSCATDEDSDRAELFEWQQSRCTVGFFFCFLIALRVGGRRSGSGGDGDGGSSGGKVLVLVLDTWYVGSSGSTAATEENGRRRIAVVDRQQ
jgi:hypothetical protein